MLGKIYMSLFTIQNVPIKQYRNIIDVWKDKTFTIQNVPIKQNKVFTFG